jgi:hypothetical protein
VKQNGGFVWVYSEPEPGDNVHNLFASDKRSGTGGGIVLGAAAIRVLFVSAMPKPRCSANGAIDVTTRFLQKPFSLSTLARKIREVLDAEIPALADAVSV